MTTELDLTLWTTSELDGLGDDLFAAIRQRREDASRQIVADAELIARVLGQPVLDETAKTPNKKDGHWYHDAQFTIRIDVYGNAQQIIFAGRTVWSLPDRVYLPDPDWMAWIETTATQLRHQETARREAQRREKVLQGLHDSLQGTEFTSVAAALQHFQLGPFAPPAPVADPATPPHDDLDRDLSASDIRRQLLVAGLTNPDDPANRIGTLRLIRQQFGLHSTDTVLCQAVVARIEDAAELDEVRREAVATAWHWMNWWSREQTITSTALLGLMDKGGAAARLVIEGMARLGKGTEPTDDDE